MKKLLSFTMMFIVCISVFSQSHVHFQLTSKCTYEVPNSEKNYYVFSFEGQTKSGLYEKALKAVTKTFVSAKDVVSKVENSMISINSTKIHKYLIGGLVPNTNYITYVLEFEFKDGRIKVNAPSLVKIMNAKGETPPIQDFILTRDGRLGSGADYYLFVNDIINSILSEMEKQDDNW